MKKLVCILLLIFLINNFAFALDFDESVDIEIRQNNNVEETALPALPNYVPTAECEIPLTPTYNPTGKTYTLKRGTKIKLVSVSSISSQSHRNSTVTFRTKEGFITSNGTIIPTGTIIKGKITDAHSPQITGNGGLIELDVNEIYFNGIKSPIGTKLSEANSKKIFFNNIKGKRKYWKNVSKTMTPGRKVFSATQNCANAMATVPVIKFISFVPLVGGAVFYTANLAVAPVISIFKKGDSITLPAGTEFQIKLTQNSEIKG